MRKFEILAGILLDFNGPQEQFTVKLAPGDGHIECDDEDVWLITSNGRVWSINFPHVIERYLQEGKVREL